MAKRLIRGRRWIWLGVALFLALLVARAPAALVGLLVPAGNLSLEDARGTVWDGSAEVWLRQQPAGVLSWTWLPSALADAELGVALALHDEGMTARANVLAGSGHWRVAAASGRIEEQALLRLLQPFDLGVTGRLRFADVNLEHVADSWRAAAGNVHWDGGLLAYRMQGRRYEAALPPMQSPLALRDGALFLAARPIRPVGAAGTAPLLTLRLKPDGWFAAGASRAFIELAGQPWQGSTKPADIVLEVEEKLF